MKLKVGRRMHSNRLTKFRKLQKDNVKNRCSEKILMELGFLLEMSAAEDHRFDNTILPQIERLFDAAKRDGAITITNGDQVEKDLLLLGTEAKQSSVYYFMQPNFKAKSENEPEYILEEVRQAISFLEKNESLTYFEPRTSVYRLLEKYQPILFKKVKSKVASGQWQVGLTSWESTQPCIMGAQRSLYNYVENKKYLENLLEIDNLDTHFELRGLSSSAKTKDMLALLDIKYNYSYGSEHQRGYSVYSTDEKKFFSVEIPTQEKLDFQDELSFYIRELFRNKKTKSVVRIITLYANDTYITKRTIQRLSEMSQWALFPTIKPMGVRDFIEMLCENSNHDTNNHMGSIGFSDEGFYKTHRDMYSGNYEGEILDARILDAQANMILGDYKTQSLFSRLKKTRLDFSSGYKETEVIARVNKEHAINSLCMEMDTKDINYGSYKNTGFEHSNFAVLQHERGHLPISNRTGNPPFLFTVFNTTQYQRNKVVELELHHWNYPVELLMVMDSKGNELIHQVEESDKNGYVKLCFLTALPEFGYMTYRILPKDDIHLEPTNKEKKVVYKGGERILLENKYIRALFSVKDMSLISLKDKESGKELLKDGSGTGTFQIVLQQDESINTHKMAAAMTKELNRNYPVYIKNYFFGGVRGWVEYQIPFDDCVLTVRIILEQECKNLKWDVKVNWIPESIKPKGSWKLAFELDHKFSTSDFRFFTTWGAIDNPLDDEIVMTANTLVPVSKESSETVVVTAKGHHSFQKISNKIIVNLLENRNQVCSVYSPNDYAFSIGVGSGSHEASELCSRNSDFISPIYIKENSVHSGDIPAFGALMTVSGKAYLVHGENIENTSGMILRYHSTSDINESIEVSFVRKLKSAHITDVYGEELELLHLYEKDNIVFGISPGNYVTIKVLFE